MYRRFKPTNSKDIRSEPDENRKEPTHGSYGGLLFDKRWRNKREEILQKDNRTCRVCKSVEELQVHHRQYHYLKAEKKFKVPWDYPDQLLITLCEKCHQKGHNKYKVPIIYL